jgi:hypothetical protein
VIEFLNILVLTRQVFVRDDGPGDSRFQSTTSFVPLFTLGLTLGSAIQDSQSIKIQGCHLIKNTGAKDLQLIVSQ